MPSAGRSLSGMLLLRLFSQIFTFAALIILTRMLGPSQYGVYSFMISCMWFASLFNIHGLNDVTVREILTQPDKRNTIYRSSLSIKLIIGVAGYLITEAIIIKFNIFPVSTWVSLTIGLTLFASFTLGSVRMIWDVPYQVDFRMVSASTINLISKALFFIMIVGIIVWQAPHNGRLETVSFIEIINLSSFPGGVSVAILLLVIAEICGLWIQVAVNKRFQYPMLPMWDKQTIRSLVHEVWPMAISGAFLLMVGRTNILMLRWFLSDHQVGLFAAPMQLIEALYIIPTVIMATMLPILSKTHRQSLSAFKQLIKIIFKLMLVISTVIAGIVSFHSHELIHLLFGESFKASAVVMSIYIWTAMMVFGVSVVQTAVIAAGRQRWLMVIYALHLTYIIGLNAYLIPRYGINGAAGGFLASYGMVFITLLFIPKISYLGRIWIVAGILPVTAALIIGWGASKLNLGLWVSVGVIPILLIGILWLIGWFSRAEYELGRTMLHSKGEGVA